MAIPSRHTYFISQFVDKIIPESKSESSTEEQVDSGKRGISSDV